MRSLFLFSVLVWGLHYRNVTTVLRQIYDSQCVTILLSSPDFAVTAGRRPPEITVFRNENRVPAISKGDDTMPGRERQSDQNESIAFNDAVLPHLDAAYNLARWLTRNDHDAEDVVQEASLRAFKYWAGISHRDSRSWLLAIVRNTFYTWLRQGLRDAHPLSDADLVEVGDENPNPERAALHRGFSQLVQRQVVHLDRSESIEIDVLKRNAAAVALHDGERRAGHVIGTTAEAFGEAAREGRLAGAERP